MFENISSLLDIAGHSGGELCKDRSDFRSAQQTAETGRVWLLDGWSCVQSGCGYSEAKTALSRSAKKNRKRTRLCTPPDKTLEEVKLDKRLKCC